MSQDAPRHEPPARVRVTAPHDSPPLPGPPLQAGTPEDFYLRSLIRSQLRLSLSVAVGFTVLLVVIAVLVAFWPQIHEVRVGTVPVSWLLLGVGIYPIVLAAGALYNRACARNERRYRDLTSRP
ncbi:hypothetical protein GCM10022377_12710 [Zhihengliuella alba]|uniref:DUF485 domain-containing protein n=1 Tax=Zhihengliuella alba TaxID=547018 RepID=A0ABP7D8B6_9MICC